MERLSGVREGGSKALERWHLCCCLFSESREANLKCRFGNDLDFGHEKCARGAGGARIGATISPEEEEEHSNGAGDAAAPPRACIPQRERQRARFRSQSEHANLKGRRGSACKIPEAPRPNAFDTRTTHRWRVALWRESSYGDLWYPCARTKRMICGPGGAHSYGGIPDAPALIRPAMKTELPKLEDAKITPTHHNQNSSQVLSGFRSTMGILSCIAVMFLSAISALFAEAFSWYMVYRKPDYQRLKRHIETVAKDLEKKKAEPVGMDSTKKREKGQRLITRLEKDLADAVKELQALATPSKLAVAALVMAVMFGVKKSFEGIVVAKLPFVPFSLLQKISHRGLEGDDATDCAVPFLFALCQATIKANISKLVSVGQPKGVKEPSPFADLNAQYDETEKKIQ